MNRNVLLAAALTATVALVSVGSARSAERAIEKSAVIDATLDQAWDSWTTREGIVGFFAPDAKIEPKLGGAFQIYFDPMAEPGLKGADDMKYMALQPKKMISFDWNAPPSLSEVRDQHTFVTVRFEPVTDKQTRVTIHHTGWGDGGQWTRPTRISTVRGAMCSPTCRSAGARGGLTTGPSGSASCARCMNRRRRRSSRRGHR